jgi:aldehyde:ferredoxin oxidoreductase
VNAKKLFNIRAGWTPAEDRLPKRFLQAALGDDPEARLTADQLAEAIAAYNLARGWSRDGFPPAELPVG